jgi:hypothetical protein
MKPSLLFFSGLFIFLLSGCGKTENASPKKDGQAGSITRFAIVDNYLYALDQNQILVYSLSEGAQPVLVSKVRTDYGLQTIIEYGGSLFVGSRDALYIVNIDNPTSPYVQGKHQREIVLGGCDPVVVKENRAYSTVKNIPNACGRTAASSMLFVYDVSDKSKPVVIQQMPMNRPNGLGYSGQTLFVCDEGTDKVHLFEILADGKLLERNMFIAITNPIDVIVKNNMLVVSHEKGFIFYDISDIQNIRMLSTIAKS